MAEPRKASIAFIFATLVIDLLGLGLVAPILPRLIQDLSGGSIAEASWFYGLLVALYAGMQFLFAPLLGALSDRFGRRPVLLLAMAGLGLDYLILAIAPTLFWLIFARTLAGICGATFTTATAYIADITPPEKRAANFGLIGAAFGLGFIFGPALGGLLGDIHVRLPFVVAGALSLLNFAFGWFVLPESLKPENRRPFALRQANPVGAVLSIMRYPALTGLLLIYVLINISERSLQAIWVLYTAYRYNWGPTETGLSLAAIGLFAGTVQGVFVRKFVAKLGEPKTALIGLVIAVAGYMSYGFASQPWMLYATMVFAVFGGLTQPSISALMSRTVLPNQQGMLQGALGSLQSFTGIVAPPMAAALFAGFIGPTAPAEIPGMPFFAAALLYVFALLIALRSRLKVPPAPAPVA
jgi:DHA1 family tetracycline resistance protein-like MFS transporter